MYSTESANMNAASICLAAAPSHQSIFDKHLAEWQVRVKRETMSALWGYIYTYM